MLFGFGSFTYPWAIGVPGQPRLAKPMDAFGLLEAAIRRGVRGVQYVDNLPLTALSADELDRLTGRAREAGVAVEVGMRGTDAEGVREHLALARRVRSRFVRIMPDKGDDRPTPEEIVARLRPLLPEFADASVLVALENHERIPVRRLRAVVEELGTETVRVCLDTTNSWGALETPEHVVETLAALTCNLHLKDFTVRRVPSQLGFVVEGAPAGTGVLDIPGILRRLPPDASITLEQWTPWQGDIEATALLESQFAQASTGYVTRVLAEVGRA